MIRKMLIEDYPKIYELWLNTPGMGLNSKNDSLESIDIFLKRNPETCFVYEEDGEIIGTILGGSDGRRGYIYHLSVKVSDRRKGIGSSLVDAVIEAFKIEGINKIGMLVFGKNELGNDFWEKRGFKARTDVYYRDKVILESERIDIIKLDRS